MQDVEFTIDSRHANVLRQAAKRLRAGEIEAISDTIHNRKRDPNADGIAADRLRSIVDIRACDFLNAVSEHEVWRSIPGFPLYIISSWGKVQNQKTGLVLKPGLVKGYEIVSLCRDGEVKTVRVHRVVADVFLGPAPFQNALVAHNDGTRANNVVRNLRWASGLENQRDRVRHKTNVRGSDVFGAKLSEEQIPNIRVRIARGETYQSIADDYGVDKGTIFHIKKGKTWRHAGGASWALLGGHLHDQH